MTLTVHDSLTFDALPDETRALAMRVLAERADVEYNNDDDDDDFGSETFVGGHPWTTYPGASTFERHEVPAPTLADVVAYDTLPDEIRTLCERVCGVASGGATLTPIPASGDLITVAARAWGTILSVAHVHGNDEWSVAVANWPDVVRVRALARAGGVQRWTLLGPPALRASAGPAPAVRSA